MTSTDLNPVLDALAESYLQPGPLNNLDTHALPNRRAVIEGFVHLQHLMFLGFFSTQKLNKLNYRDVLSEHLNDAADLFCTQIGRAAAWVDRGRPEAERRCAGWCRRTTVALLSELPELRKALHEDVLAAYQGDPAAESIEEVVFSYPSIHAVTAYRVAHILFKLGVPLIPRIISEHAHTRTGIDIHPGASIGPRFFIDHGTGVVIGATTVIGADVRLYQGVTLGAMSVDGTVERRRDLVQKRHPTLGDRVTVYAETTILGGDTVIGDDSLIGGNVWLTHSVPPHSRVYFNAQRSE